MQLINVTPHVVTVSDEVGTALASWPPSGIFTRLVESSAEGRPLAADEGLVPVVHMSYTGEIEGLPAPKEGTAYIVSRVLAAAVDRSDLYFPFDEVRDARGQIVGCRALGQYDHGGKAAPGSTTESEGTRAK